jgi:8-oxo-dGTP pyrophosphatase MutT (NUDIX family)
MPTPDCSPSNPTFDQVGVVPYRHHGGSIEVLLITSRTHGRWIVPKGNIEANLGPRRSARMEALEEAGVDGNLADEPLGIYRHGNPPEHCVRLYLMHVKTEYATWPEDHERTRRWLKLRTAQHTVDEDGIRSLLNEAAQRLW